MGCATDSRFTRGATVTDLSTDATDLLPNESFLLKDDARSRPKDTDGVSLLPPLLKLSVREKLDDARSWRNDCGATVTDLSTDALDLLPNESFLLKDGVSFLPPLLKLSVREKLDGARIWLLDGADRGAETALPANPPP